MSTLFVDIECYRNFYYIGMMRAGDRKRVGVEFSERSNFDREWIRNLFLRNTTIGFNSFGYDLPMIWFSLQDGVTNDHLKEASDRIIKRGIKYWEVENELGIRIPWDVKKKHIDLIEPQPNAFASLKSLNGRMHGRRLLDLPYHPDTILTHEQMDEVADYCLNNDIDATEKLHETLKEPLDLRVSLGEIYGRDFRSKSDAQIGEAIVKIRAEQILGHAPRRATVDPGTKFKYNIPPYIKFEDPTLKGILDRLRDFEFEVKESGKVDLPDWLADAKLKIGNTIYQMGIGGLHSTESNRCVRSNDQFALVDADVASQYPSIIVSLGLYPKSLGPTFLEIYKQIITDRLAAKKRAKEIEEILPGVNDPDRIAELKLELLRCKVIDKGAKIQLNGVYGKLGSPYSVLYAPNLLIAVTLTGQLTLLMMAEQAEKRGIGVVSGNTDGVLFRVPRSKYAGLNKDRLKPCELSQVTDDWEKMTGFNLEFAEYKAIYNLSVNAYYALKANGGHKRKGPVGNPWNNHKDDFDQVRGQLMKNPQMTICSDAALAFIKDGKPVTETIRECRDITQFITVIKASKGATWKGKYLAKTVRFYWGLNGEPIYESVPHEKTGNFKKISKTEGAVECMTLPDEFPSDIDYARYVEEAEKIIREYGYYNEYDGSTVIGEYVRRTKPAQFSSEKWNEFLMRMVA